MAVVKAVEEHRTCDSNRRGCNRSPAKEVGLVAGMNFDKDLCDACRSKIHVFVGSMFVPRTRKAKAEATK